MWLDPTTWFASGDYDSSSTGNSYQPGGKNAPGYKNDTLIDWTARNEFVDPAYEQELNDLGAADRVKIKQQIADGKITQAEGNYNLGLADQVGTKTYDQSLGKRGVGSFLGALPWWAWALLAAGGVGLFFYFGGFSRLKGVLKK